jgi:outer membrane lipase/esterase
MFRQLLPLKFSLLLSGLLPIPVLAQSIDGITVLGDSLSDNGNAFRLTNGVTPASPPYFNGRFSNGPVWVEDLPGALKLPAASSNNFAVGGAGSGTANTVNSSLPGLRTEVDQLLLLSPTLNPKQLFVIWAGANDYLGSGATTVAPTVSNLSNAVQRLTTAGARQVVVANLPDLGKLPVGGQSAALTQITAAHNSALRTSLQTLARNNPDLSIIPTDMAALFNAAITNPARFGFTNVTEPCLNVATGAVCATPNTYLFWDTIHPTAAANRLISAYTLDTITAPRSIATQAETALGNANRQTRDINGRLLALRSTPLTPTADRKIGVFVNADSNFGDRSATNTNAGFKIDTKSVTVGADYPVTPNLAVGVAFSSANNNNQLNDSRGKVAVDSTSLSIYGGYTQDKFYTDAMLNYG